MSNYRVLNKELVEQVQTMRKDMKLCCDEIVYLKRQLMQNHESQVFLKNTCYDWAINNFVQLIQYIQPDSSILPTLKEHIESEKRRSCPTERTELRRSRRSDAPRRSSFITRDFQRSFTITQFRKSVCNTSPIRENNESRNEVHEEDPVLPDNDGTQTEISRTVRRSEIDNIIFEESDEETEGITRDEDLDIQSIYDSGEEVSNNICENRNALNNITNSMISGNMSPRPQTLEAEQLKEARSRPKRTKKKHFADKENSSDDYMTSKEDSDPESKRKLTRQTRLTDKTSKEIEDDTLQEPRRYANSRCNFDSNKFSPKQNNGQMINNEVTLNLNDVTLKNFRDAACSTPNSRKNSLEATTASRVCDTTSDMQTSASTSTRPSRHCKPKNLAEPSLHTKLRSESKEKVKKSTARRSAKSKTKK